MWHAIGIFQPPGWGWFAIALGAGLVGGGRPARRLLASALPREVVVRPRIRRAGSRSAPVKRQFER
jgi:hypothetical protein